jgi:peroxiredoxin
MTVKWAMLAPFVALGGAVAVPAARAQAIESGQVLPDVTLARVDGGSAPLIDRASSATAVIFFRAPHERSEETLRMLAACQPRLAGKPVRLVGVVPADSAEAARAAAQSAGAKLPVLVDRGDAVYSAAGVRTHPAIAIVDRARKVVAFAPSVEAWRLEGEAFAAEGRCPDARRAFDAALALDPGDRETTAARQACGR